MKNLSEVVQGLREHERKLHDLGVQRIWVFGSTARNEQNEDSDLDICVDIYPDLSISLFELARVKLFLEDLFCMKVDLVERQGFKPRIRAEVDRDAVFAF